MTLALCLTAPFAGAVVVALAGGRLGRRGAAVVALASLAVAWVATAAMAQAFAAGRAAIVVELGSWLPIRGSMLAVAATPASIALLLAATAGPALLIAAVALGGSPAAMRRSFYAGAALYGSSAALISVAADLALVAAGWQLAGVATHVLMRGAEDRAAVVAPAGRGFGAHRAGDMAFLLAVAALVALFSTSDIAEIARRLDVSLLDDPRPRIAASLALPSALVVAAVVGTAALPLRGLVVAWRGAPFATRLLAAVVGVAPAAIALIRLAAILHPSVLAVGVAAAMTLALLNVSGAPVTRAMDAGARALENGMESAVGRAGALSGAVMGGASSLVRRAEESRVRVREAVLLAAALAVVAYWTVR